MTHRELGALQLAIYGQWFAKWDYLSDGTEDSHIVFGVQKTAAGSVICFRGSVTPLDWLRDFLAFADPFSHAKLGPVHPGFFAGMEGCYAHIRKYVPEPYIVIGHSLGAARATLLTGLLAADGIRSKRVVWGEPLSCFPEMAAMLDLVGSTGTSYRNTQGGHHDIVCSVPVAGRLESYVRCSALTDLSVVASDRGPLALHHMGLYASATPETAT